MLSKNDLNKLSELFTKLFKTNFEGSFKPAFKEAFEESFTPAFNASFRSIWEHNLEPSLNQIHDDISKLPTKEYLDDKLSTQKIEILSIVRKEYKK